MVNTPQNSTSTHTLRLRSDASGMVKELNAVDRELADVVRQLDRVRAVHDIGAGPLCPGAGRQLRRKTEGNPI